MLLGAMIVAGWDKLAGGPIWGCPISGTLVKERWAIDGSGSTYIWGFLDAEYRCASTVDRTSLQPVKSTFLGVRIALTNT